jgi:hypothetical protein
MAETASADEEAGTAVAIKGRRFPVQQPRLWPYALTLPPSAPTGLSVTNDATNPTTALDLSWNAVTGATSYNVLQASSLGGTFAQIASGVNTNSYTVSGLTAANEYAFKVQTVNGNGTSPASSAVAWATEPAAPSIVQTSASATSFQVLATAPTLGSNIEGTGPLHADFQFRYETPVGAGNWANFDSISALLTVLTANPLTQYGVESSYVIQSSNGDWAGTIQGPWGAELTLITPAFGTQATVVLAGPKNPVGGKQRKVIQPILGRSIETGVPPGVPTPNYTGYTVLAKQKGIKPRVRDCIVYASPVIGAPPPSISLPRYTGLFVRPVPRPRTQYRHRLSRLRLTPAGGFVGAKLAFLTVTPTRKATNFTVTPTRQANLTVQ